ncbi:unnamed protein product [Adineta ricciae]|uniref:Uncharacterized protein n=1 Tax=Adineta ricciae TaxID=249248 RepID=A0A813YUA7_ADIRI|nr:unnamed protein product [Adineta ricciae]CAF0888875.1 unnamed protein product [Adineta ricciae]
MKNLNPIYDALNLQKWPRSHSNETSNTVLNQNVRRQLHTEALTEENFHQVHLSHRRIEDFPTISHKSLMRSSIYPISDSIIAYTDKNADYLILALFFFVLDLTIHDIDRLKSMNVHTIQDLLGRCLIHDTLDEFHMFLLNGFRLSEKTASGITNLFSQWIDYNLNGIQSNH